ncbi:sigma 54-interacting transcriptional regulator [Flintibacter sp. KGMB00164]|uniref:sigma-54 interaction domain-containing protein n=1 Tax=Flintibacter sp. KGMB00164 TaxID=2610895 RepID=UPI001244211B|nr:sigma 54-interacting transcriptional regulator [Flintibacter sp. KGMB00164]
MEFLQELFHGKGYIDGITIINLEGEILFTAKFNDKFRAGEQADELVGKHFLDVYENLDPETSTTIKAMERGVPAYVENQYLKTKGREGIRITSLSIPIKWGDRIVGAIDLSTQEREPETHPESSPIRLTPADFSQGETQKLTDRDSAMFSLETMIAEDEKMQQIRDYIPVVAACELPVMIYGETGTGKEVVAQAIHNASPRRDMPFVAQNCAALPETLLESILFGTAKGAFTGAAENKGLFELANGGTLFLDEINSMPIQLQSKLLRVLQDGRFRRLGGKETVCVDVKVIAAMNTDPLQAIQQGQLRQDIYYRLSMMSVHIPPLRERKADIPAFLNFYINKHNATFHKNIEYVSRELISNLESYSWPGNLRELEHTIVYAMSHVSPHEHVLQVKDLREPLSTSPHPFLEHSSKKAQNPAAVLPLRQAVQEYESGLIRKALQAAGGNVSQAARSLQIPRQTLCRRIREYGLSGMDIR